MYILCEETTVPQKSLTMSGVTNIEENRSRSTKKNTTKYPVYDISTSKTLVKGCIICTCTFNFTSWDFGIFAGLHFWLLGSMKYVLLSSIFLHILYLFFFFLGPYTASHGVHPGALLKLCDYGCTVAILVVLCF